MCVGGGGSGKGSWEQTMRSAGRREGKEEEAADCGLDIVCMCHEDRLGEGGREKGERRERQGCE